MSEQWVPIEFDQQTKNVAETMRTGRDKLLPFFGNITFKAKSEDAHDVVTELDTWTEETIRDNLQQCGRIAVFGEELGYDPQTEEHDYWLLDGIDGTAAFTRGIASCTNMAARIVGNTVVAAVVYSFVNDELYVAERGKGAYKNGRPITVSDRGIHQAATRLEARADIEENVALASQLEVQTWPVHFMAGGIEYAYVAEGKIEARITNKPYGKHWDFAPGSLLVEEAGGMVANLGKTTYSFQDLDFIATNPRMFKDLTEGESPLLPLT